MDVSVIIVNYKTPGLVADCVASLAEKTRDIRYEVIVVDNGSGDDSLERLGRMGDAITLIDAGENLGFGRANNLGARYARGEYLFLLNSDTLLINNALKILVDHLRANPRVGVAGGNLYDREGKPNGSYCDAFDDLKTLDRQRRWGSILLEILRRRRMERVKDPEKQRRLRLRHNFNFTGRPKPVAYLYGADMMLPRALFERMGGFDPDFFMYAEEEELSWRITQAGYALHSVPEAKIIHFDGASVNRDHGFSEKHYAMRQTGAMTYYEKRFGPEGAQRYYRCRLQRLQRQERLARLFRRPMLLEAARRQAKCLEESREAYLRKGKG